MLVCHPALLSALELPALRGPRTLQMVGLFVSSYPWENQVLGIPLSDQGSAPIRVPLSSFQPIPESRESFRTILLPPQSLSDTWHIGSKPDSFTSVSGHCNRELSPHSWHASPIPCMCWAPGYLFTLEKAYCSPGTFGRLSHIFPVD